jgi:prepilin-type N-terminal cleavage/methylation domain-containing protein
MNTKKNERGFSLVELLVVVIIIAIVAAIAIPNLLSSRKAANEASAISSLRTIHSAQATYQATLGGNTAYAGAIGGLSATGVDLIDDQLGTGSKSGYTFTVASSASQVYCAEAHPTTPGTTGTRSFAVNQQGVIMGAPGDTIDCDAGTGNITGTSVGAIQ